MIELTFNVDADGKPDISLAVLHGDATDFAHFGEVDISALSTSRGDYGRLVTWRPAN